MGKGEWDGLPGGYRAEDGEEGRWSGLALRTRWESLGFAGGGSVNKAVVDDAMDEPVGVECLCLAWLA